MGVSADQWWLGVAESINLHGVLMDVQWQQLAHAAQ
jgi:hypothetical protein